MADTTSPEAAVQAEDEGFYHESALNATWTGSRLAIGGLTFLFGAFLFAYFYLRSLNSSGRWQGSGYIPPSLWQGTVIMLLAEVSAGVNYFGLQRIKAGPRAPGRSAGWSRWPSGWRPSRFRSTSSRPCRSRRAVRVTPASSPASTRSS